MTYKQDCMVTTNNYCHLLKKAHGEKLRDGWEGDKWLSARVFWVQTETMFGIFPHRFICLALRGGI